MQSNIYFVPVVGVDLRYQSSPILQRIALLQGIQDVGSYRADELVQLIRFQEQDEGGLRLSPDLINSLLSNSVVRLPDGSTYILAGSEIDPRLLQQICPDRPCTFLQYLEGTRPAHPRATSATSARLEGITTGLSALRIGKPVQRPPPITQLPPPPTLSTLSTLPTPPTSYFSRPTVGSRLTPTVMNTTQPSRLQTYRIPPQAPPPLPPPAPVVYPSPEEQERLRQQIIRWIQRVDERQRILSEEQREYIRAQITLKQSGVPENQVLAQLSELNPTVVRRQKRFDDYMIFINAERNRLISALQVLSTLDSPEKIDQLRGLLNAANRFEIELRQAFRESM